MKSYLQVLIVFAWFCLPYVGFSQDETDSVAYVVPTTSKADLSMYTPPAGFIVAQQFNGYYHTQTQASVVMTYIESANYAKIHEGLTEEYYNKNQLTFIKNEKIRTDSGLTGLVAVAEFDLEGKRMVRHLVFIGDLNNTLWLSVTFPKAMETLVEGELLKSYSSVHFLNK